MKIQEIISRSIRELEKAGIQSASIDVKVLLQHTLEQDDIYLITHNLDLITNSQYQKFRRLIRRRKRGEPVAYLTGHKEFYGLDFIVNKNVLIPRPESEILVSQALEIIKNRTIENSKPINIIDIGTGSGCLILSLAKLLINVNQINFYASDISSAALNVAKRNAKFLGCHNVRFFQSDLLGNGRIPKHFDLIIANLPYLTNKKTDTLYSLPGEIGLQFEPNQALYAKDGGFALIKQLVEKLPRALLPKGTALLEIDESHLEKISALCHKRHLKSTPIQNPSRFKGFVEISF